MTKIIIIFILIFYPIDCIFSQITLPNIFGDNMVLQQESKVKLWGWSESNSNTQVEITTSWDNNTYTSNIDEEGKWSKYFKTPMAGGPFKIIIKDKEESVQLSNVLIGEVWLCSGQSNMAMAMSGNKNQPIMNSASIIGKATNSKLRLFQVEEAYSGTSQNNLKGEWKNSNPENVRDFSAVGFQFGQMLQKKLDIPVGIIVSSWGGTPIKAWMSSQSIGKFPRINAEDVSVEHKSPSVLYNAMIAPLTSYPVAGFLWYQGESDRRRSNFYEKALPAMVKQWRMDWGLGGIPFYYVQIAPWTYPNDNEIFSPYLREAQLKAVGEIPNSGMVVTADIGSSATIHPPDKTTVAKRLVNYALGQTYGRNLNYKGPRYKKFKIKENKIIVYFENAKELKLKKSTKNNFEIAGSDRKFFPAEVSIIENHLELESDMVKKPVAVRYAFKNYFIGNLFNAEGLPASPFRTDNWEKVVLNSKN